MRMKVLPASVVLALLTSAPALADEVLFQDDFKLRLGAGWSWVREHREAWRVFERGLDVRIVLGNMCGVVNDARSVLIRPAPVAVDGEVEVTVMVENHRIAHYM